MHKFSKLFVLSMNDFKMYQRLKPVLLCNKTSLNKFSILSLLFPVIILDYGTCVGFANET